MKYRRKLIYFNTMLFLISFIIINLPSVFAHQSNNKPKYIFIMIGDGMGYNQVKASSFYQYAHSTGQIYHQFDIRLAMTTYARGGSYDPELAWSDFEYLKRNPTDSAAAATAMSTGRKTRNGFVGMNPEGDKFLHLFSKAKKNGKFTGLVTSVPISHATQAAFVAHNTTRLDYISIGREMILGDILDVLMGAGHPHYDNDGQPTDEPDYRFVGGEEIWNGLIEGKIAGEKTDWTLIQNLDEFRHLMDGETPKRVLGIPKVRGTLQQNRSGDTKADPYVVPFNQDIPRLYEMTAAALNILDQNPKGFIIMVDGGAIDWAGHGNQSGRLIEEQIDFDQTVELVVDWVQKYSNWEESLVIVTGDHETGYLTGPGSGPDATPIHQPLINNGQGNLPGMQWNSIGHTNSLVPFFAKGVGSNRFTDYIDGSDPVWGEYIDNTAIGKVLLQFENITVDIN